MILEFDILQEWEELIDTDCRNNSFPNRNHFQHDYFRVALNAKETYYQMVDTYVDLTERNMI